MGDRSHSFQNLIVDVTCVSEDEILANKRAQLITEHSKVVKGLTYLTKHGTALEKFITELKKLSDLDEGISV